MIACHHDRHKAPDLQQRKALSEISLTLSQSIGNALSRSRRLSAARVKAREVALRAALPDPAAVLPGILFGPERLRNLLHCCGTAVWSAHGLIRMGDAPAANELEGYAARLLAGTEDIVALDSRVALVARLGLAPQNPSLAGLIAIVVSREVGLILFGFRLEVIREILWGGDINQPVLHDEQTGAVGPRRSFAQYKQRVLGKAETWTEEHIATAELLRDILRAREGEPEQMRNVIAADFTKVRCLVAGEYTFSHSFLEAISSGVSLVFRSDPGSATVLYANQTLLDLIQANSDVGTALPAANEILAALGLPADLLNRSEFEAFQVLIPTAQQGLRHFLVERKLALEIKDNSGAVSLSALLLTDTTREERARETLRASEDRAKYLTLLKSSFLANMSHEIRTPMNGILGMVQLLQNTRKDPEQQRYLDIIQRSGDSLLSLINDILDLSKIEAGYTEIEKAPFDLSAVVEGVVDLMRPKAYEKSIGLSAVLESPPPRWYIGDSFRLRQVILNIVGNAIKFTSTGKVTIFVQCEDLTEESASVVISVADTGIGISEKELSRVFDKFHQADQSTTRKHGGTGLGLAISRELVSLMGGTISLASTLGVGSTFTVTLPLMRTSDPDQAQATNDLVAISGIAQSRSPGAGSRILVAEDDLTNQIVIEEILKTGGFEVVIASSGLRVLDLLADRPFDLILMDCHMPELDGYQTTARIRAMEGSQRHIPIVALTASASAEDRQRCLNVGMDDHLSKPVHVQGLWDVLRKWKCPPNELANMARPQSLSEANYPFLEPVGSEPGEPPQHS